MSSNYNSFQPDSNTLEKLEKQLKCQHVGASCPYCGSTRFLVLDASQNHVVGACGACLLVTYTKEPNLSPADDQAATESIERVDLYFAAEFAGLPAGGAE